jgi:hypothetical protein
VTATPEGRRAALEAQLDEAARAWLADAVRAVRADAAAVRRFFPAAGRKLGRGPFDPAADPADPHAWTVDDAGRVELLLAAGGAHLERLYVHGDAAERRGVLRALDVLPATAEGRAVLLDALRTNDVRLVAAAAGGTYAAAELTDAELAQALLKCLFVGVPLRGVPALARVPADAARMAADLVRERVAAGRDVPADAWLLLDPYPGVLERAGLPAELDSPDPYRRAAARRFLGARSVLPSPREG